MKSIISILKYSFAVLILASTAQVAFATTNWVHTHAATQITTDSAVLAGTVFQWNHQETEAWFVLQSGSTAPSCSSLPDRYDVSGLYNTGDIFSATIDNLNPHTQYTYRACTSYAGGVDRSFTTDDVISPEPDAQVITNAVSNVSINSARLHGEIIIGSEETVWFVAQPNSIPQCSDIGAQYGVSGSYNGGDSFNLDINNISADTLYYFRACTDDDQGDALSFMTDDVTPIEDGMVMTQTADPVDNTTATLRAQVTAGENENVWFVVREGFSTVYCYQSEYRYDVAGSFSAGASFNRTVTGLNENSTHYYRACTTDDQGDLFDFTTTTNNEVDPLVVVTAEATEIDRDSARLNAVISPSNSTASYPVFFRYATTNNISCTSGTLVNIDGLYEQSTSFNKTLSGLNSETNYYYIACAQDTDNAYVSGVIQSFQTEVEETETQTVTVYTASAQDISDDDATLRGQLDSGTNQIVWFVFDDTSSISCTNSSIRESVSGTYNSGDSFERDVNGLDDDRRYYYRACAGSSSNPVSGEVRDFETDDDDDDRDDYDDPEVYTLYATDISSNRASMCGDLDDDGGDRDTEVWFEYRASNESSYDRTSKEEEGEGRFCDNARNLRNNTRYYYRACAENEEDEVCGVVKYFTTSGQVLGATNIPTTFVPTQTVQPPVQNIGNKPSVATYSPLEIRANYAALNGYYAGNGAATSVWFEYGRTATLGRTTVVQTKGNTQGAYTHPFTQLSANTTYYYRAIAQNRNGIARGSLLSFRTLPAPVPVSVTTNTPKTTPTPPAVTPVEIPTVVREAEVEERVQIVEVSPQQEKLQIVGYGLSYVMLNIRDNTQFVTENERVEYRIEWENISEYALNDVELKVTIPQDITIANATRGSVNAQTNTVFVNLGDLRPFEEGRIVVSGVVARTVPGASLLTEAMLAFENPINGSQEDASDYDENEFVLPQELDAVSASVFGLGSITFLGWLAILLGLLILFLIARWLYLEREELRAQAYMNNVRRGYTPESVYSDPRQGYYQQDVVINPRLDGQYRDYRRER